MARGHRARAQPGTMPSANGALPALVWDVKRRRVYLDRADRVRWRVHDCALRDGVTDASVAVWQAEARRVERAAGPWAPAAERQFCMQLVAGDGP